MIHFSESFEKFLVEADSRIAHILFNVRYSSHPAWQLYVTNKNIDYLAHREDGTISFLPAGLTLPRPFVILLGLKGTRLNERAQ